MYTDLSVEAFSGSTYQPLGQKTFWFLVSKRIGAGVFFLLAAFGLSLVRAQSFVSPDVAPLVRVASWALLAFAAVALAAGFLSSWLVYRNSGFLLAEDALRIRRGVFTKQETAIPYRQIQNIDIERTITQQIAGLSRLVIYTASRDEVSAEGDDSKKGVQHDEGVIPSIDREVAERLRAELLKRANVQKVTM